MSPTLAWGLVGGLAVALADSVALLADRNAGTLGLVADAFAWLDVLANLAIFSVVGIRVARLTGLVRDAAEAGVLAAIVVSSVNVAVDYALPQFGAPPLGTLNVVRTFAEDVAFGGLLAWASGLYATRLNQAGTSSGRRR